MAETAGDEKVVTIDPRDQGRSVHSDCGGSLPRSGGGRHQVIPAKERVYVLLEFPGLPVETDVPLPQVVSTQARRRP